LGLYAAARLAKSPQGMASALHCRWPRRARCSWQNGSSHRACRLLQASGTLLGMGKTVQFIETRVILDAGDIVVFYTDGLTEAAN